VHHHAHALLRIDAPLSSEAFRLRLLEAEGVLFVPGSCLDLEGVVRIGFANDPPVLVARLERTTWFLAGLPA